MLFFLVFGIAMLLTGSFFAVVAILSRNPENLIFTTGELTGRKKYKNYRLKNRTVPAATGYTYTYTVDGRPYQLRGVRFMHARNLRKRVEIIYLRNFPRCAYEGYFSGIMEWLLAISLVAMGIFMIAIYFVAAA